MILEEVNKFKLYAIYCSNHGNVRNRIAELREGNQKFSKFLNVRASCTLWLTRSLARSSHATPTFEGAAMLLSTRVQKIGSRSVLDHANAAALPLSTLLEGDHQEHTTG